MDYVFEAPYRKTVEPQNFNFGLQKKGPSSSISNTFHVWSVDPHI